MDTYKLRVKIGPHEFEAEGPKEDVTAQFETWKTLVQVAPKDEPPEKPTDRKEEPTIRDLPDASVYSLDQLAHIFSVDERRRLVTLRVPITGDREHADAVVLTLYGFRRFRNEDEIQATRLMRSLEASGPAPARIDRFVAPYVREGLMISAGVGKGKRYRLTNRGITRAEDIVRPLLEQLS